MNKKYAAKILLFGEQIVLKGSDALAIPFPKFGGKWVYTRYPESAKIQQMELPQFLQYLKEKSGSLDFFDIDTKAFARELMEGMYFQSNIPLGYGAGSSGSLCAAIYHDFAKEKTNDPKQLKKIFSLMESFFHGSSSGFDPLVSYLEQAVKISEGKTILLGRTEGIKGLFLVDTGIKRSASEFISIFLNKCKDAEYENRIKEEIIPLTSKAIASYLKSDATSLFHQMHDISRFQYFHFKELIPKNMIPFWEKGLGSNLFKMKICGAGGGGFMLGITKDFEKTKAIFGEVTLIEI
jgi:mevalonate kinase